MNYQHGKSKAKKKKGITQYHRSPSNDAKRLQYPNIEIKRQIPKHREVFT